MTKQTQFKPGTFVLVPNKHLLPKMSMKAQCVWLALCGYANDDGECWPSINKLSESTGLGERTIKRGMDELVELKVLKKEPRYRDDGSFSSNKYTLYLN